MCMEAGGGELTAKLSVISNLTIKKKETTKIFKIPNLISNYINVVKSKEVFLFFSFGSGGFSFACFLLDR